METIDQDQLVELRNLIEEGVDPVEVLTLGIAGTFKLFSKITTYGLYYHSYFPEGSEELVENSYQGLFSCLIDLTSYEIGLILESKERQAQIRILYAQKNAEVIPNDNDRIEKIYQKAEDFDDVLLNATINIYNILIRKDDVKSLTKRSGQFPQEISIPKTPGQLLEDAKALLEAHPNLCEEKRMRLILEKIGHDGKEQRGLSDRSLAIAMGYGGDSKHMKKAYRLRKCVQKKDQ